MNAHASPSTSSPSAGAARGTLALSLLAALVMAACAPLPTLHAPATPLAGEQLGLKAPAVQATPEAAALDPQWWTAYADPQLDALVAQAIAQSPSLALARARIARAGALIENAEAAERPTVGLQADVTRQRFSEHGMYPPPLAGSVRNTINLQAGISYEWDFFGRHEAALQSALGQQRAAQADADAARLSLAQAVARAYVALARSQAQSRLLEQQMALREQSLALVRQRAQAGLDNRAELRQAEAPLPELRRTQLALAEQQTLLRNQLAALTGQGPNATTGLQARLPQLLAWQQEPQLDLLGRRPDLAAARARVEASAQDVKLARTQFYPSVNLSAFVGLNAIGFDQVFKSGSRQMGAGPALRLPLFDTGRLRAQLKGSAAEQDAAVASYNAAVVDAVRDASDQFATLQSLRQQQRAQDELLANADSQLQLATQREQAGLVNRLVRLNATQARLLQQRQQLDLQAQAVDAQINLMRALGGGYADPAVAASASAAPATTAAGKAERS